MSQTTAPLINAVVGEVGLIAESFGPWAMESKVSQAEVFVGRLVSLGAGDDEVAAPAASGDVTATAVGVTARRLSRVSQAGAADPSFPAGESLPVLRKGKIYVEVEDAVTKGGACFVNFQNGNEGQFRSDAAAGDAVALPGAVYRTAAGAGELAVVEINLP